MKTRIFVLGCMIAVAAIALSSCKEEEFTPGDPDVDGCYGVYFPEQETALTLDPADETSLTIYVKRDSTIASGALTVPYEFHDDTGVFKCEDEIYFPADSTNTTITVTFDAAEIGVTYACYIQVTDPQYVSTYSSYASGIDISILREKWNDLGECTYTDDLLGGVFGPDPITYMVPIQENDLTPGLYRLLYPYGEIYPYNDSYDDGTADWDLENDWNIVVDATDPDRVFIDYQFLGIDWGYGPIYVESMASYYYRNGNTSDAIYNAGYYGTLKNGVITFPEKGFMITMPEYSTSGYWYGNTNGAFKIALPGASDFSFTITADEPVNGEVPIHFETTEDIASIRYAVFEGTLSEADVETCAQEIIDTTVAYEQFVNDTIACAYDINVTLAETGIYTIVAVSYDSTDDAQENASCEFCYLAAGDDMPVSVGVDMISTGKYSSDHSADHTLEFTIYGSDLKAVKYEIVKTNTYLADSGSVEDEVKSSDAVEDDVLSKINASGGYTAHGTSYTAGTEYTIVVWASNGYQSTFVTATAKTTGVFEASLESLLGTYYVTETSYFGSYYDDYEPWVFEACDEDDEEGWDFKLTYFDGWPCTTPIYGTIDLENATFSIPDWQYFYTYAYYGYDFYFSTNQLDAATFELTGDGSFTGADDLFGEYLCDAYEDPNSSSYYLGWNNAFSYVSGLRVAASEESIKPSSVRNLTPIGRKGASIKVDPYARFIQSDSREVRTASFTATPAQAKVSTSTFVKGSAPLKANKTVTPLK